MSSTTTSTTDSGYTVRAIDEMATLHDGAVKLAGAELGVESFGIQVLDFPAGFEHYPEHDHAHDGQEEVYIVMQGAAAFEIDGERVTLDPGRFLRVGANSRRKLLPGAQNIRLLAVGCTPGKSYERPQDFRLAVES